MPREEMPEGGGFVAEVESNNSVFKVNAFVGIRFTPADEERIVEVLKDALEALVVLFPEHPLMANQLDEITVSYGYLDFRVITK